jgi:hypothetical protein
LPVHELQLVLALQAYSIAGRLLVGERSLPPPHVLAGDFGVVYVDAGSRGDRLQGGFYAVKLALLARRHAGGGGVVESVFHPVPRAGSGDALPPVYVGAGGERVRQAATYIAELGSLLAVAAGYWSPWRGMGVDEPSRVLLVRHGPLLQMLSQYLSKPYHVEAREAERLLLYSGLDLREASWLLRLSHPCTSPTGGPNRNRVVLGLLALHLLDRLVVEALGRGYGVAGMVEDVSRSRLLVADAVAELVSSAAAGAGTLADAAAGIAGGVARAYASVRRLLGDCLCPSTDPTPFLLDTAGWSELLASMNATLVERLGGAGILSSPPPSRARLAAAASWSGALPQMSDSELLYTLHYLAGRGDSYPATPPMEHGARLEIVRYYLEERRELSCQKDAALQALQRLERLRYRYLAPTRPPRCQELQAEISSKGLQGVFKPCDLASLVTVPPAVRLEYVEGMRLSEEAVALTVYPARILVYGYPPQLLVVDRYSRISPAEMAFARELAEALVERLQPYTSFVRGWETRISTAF